MKRFTFRVAAFSALIVAAVATSNVTFAQSDDTQKSNIKIRVIEDDNGKIRNIQKDYTLPKMSDSERKAFVDKVLDSIGVDDKKKRSVSVTVDDLGRSSSINKSRKVTINEDGNNRVFAYRNDNDDNFDFDFKFDTEELKKNMRNLERDIKPKINMMMKDVEGWGDRMGNFIYEDKKAASIRGLNAYVNNPDNGVINLRFQTAGKGDVTIEVTDAKGKEVAKKEIKDFDGEYVGQVDLKKNTKGTLFVKVVQNEDGAVKRIVLP